MRSRNETLESVIAKEVFGLDLDYDEEYDRWYLKGRKIPVRDYSRDPECIVDLMEKIEELSPSYASYGKLCIEAEYPGKGGELVWMVGFREYSDMQALAAHKNLPMALCLAALKAKGVEYASV